MFFLFVGLVGFWFFKTGCLCITALSVLELRLQTRLASSSKTSACLCPSSARINTACQPCYVPRQKCTVASRTCKVLFYSKYIFYYRTTYCIMRDIPTKTQNRYLWLGNLVLLVSQELFHVLEINSIKNTDHPSLSYQCGLRESRQGK